MKLTIEQQEFADEYIVRDNATRAAIAARYSPKAAHRIGHANLGKPHIKAYTQGRLDQIQNEKTADQKEILGYLTSVMRRGEQEPVLKGIGEGTQEVIDVNLQARDRIEAVELLDKRYSLWTDKVDLSDGVSVTFIEGVPLDDWEKIECGQVSREGL